MSNAKAPDGKVWMCGACRKLSEFPYGFESDGSPMGKDCKHSKGWDISCMVNSVLMTEKEASLYSPFYKEYYGKEAKYESQDIKSS